jgi:hypothetical protein
MKIKFGSHIVGGSGKIGGHVVAKNRGGYYLRTKTTPTNPQSQYQMAQRSLLGSLAVSWSQLTQSQRDSFINGANDFIGTDVFGDSRTPSGQNLYVGLNINAQNGGFAPLTTAPAKQDVTLALLSKVEFQINSSEVAVQFDNASSNGDTVLIFATGTMSAGRKFSKNRMRLLGSFSILNANIEDPEAVFNAYVERFGTPSTGANIQFQVRKVVSSGQVSPAQKVTAIYDA